jgi:hypothetical protein
MSSLLEGLDRASRVASARTSLLIERVCGLFSRKDGPMTKTITPAAAEEIPPGGGSAPIPDDPAVVDPLGHLRDLPGVSESEGTPGAGLPEQAPAPPPPPPPPARAQKGE